MKFISVFLAAALCASATQHLRRSVKYTLSAESKALAARASAEFTRLDLDANGQLDMSEFVEAANAMNADEQILTTKQARALRGFKSLAEQGRLTVEKAREMAIGYKLVLGADDNVPDLDEHNPLCGPFEKVGAGEYAGLCVCANVRHDWKTLPINARKLYLQAIKKAHEDGVLYNFAQIHQAQESYAHGASTFLPWHRRYLLEFEEALRRGGDDFKCVSIPYWDWADEVEAGSGSFGSMHTDTGGFGQGSSGRPGTGSGELAGLGFGYIEYPEGPLTRGREGQRDSNEHASTSDLAYLVHMEYYEEMRSQLEGYHGTAHCTVGGEMCSMWSPKDPIFYSHHAMIDKTWLRWQQIHNKLECGADTFSGGDPWEWHEPLGSQAPGRVSHPYVNPPFSGGDAYKGGTAPTYEQIEAIATAQNSPFTEPPMWVKYGSRWYLEYKQRITCDSGLPFYDKGAFWGTMGGTDPTCGFEGNSIREAYRTEHHDGTGSWTYEVDELQAAMDNEHSGFLSIHSNSTSQAELSSELAAQALAEEDLWTIWARPIYGKLVKVLEKTHSYTKMKLEDCKLRKKKNDGNYKATHEAAEDEYGPMFMNQIIDDNYGDLDLCKKSEAQLEKMRTYKRKPTYGKMPAKYGKPQYGEKGKKVDYKPKKPEKPTPSTYGKEIAALKAKYSRKKKPELQKTPCGAFVGTGGAKKVTWKRCSLKSRARNMKMFSWLAGGFSKLKKWAGRAKKSAGDLYGAAKDAFGAAKKAIAGYGKKAIAGYGKKKSLADRIQDLEDRVHKLEKGGK